MTKVIFLDPSSIQVIAKDGEVFILQPHLPVSSQRQPSIAKQLAFSFDKNFSSDKTSMIYWVLMEMMSANGFSFSYKGSDRSMERERIGEKIRKIRLEKGIEAKQLALLAGIDAANLSRIEKGRYSVGLDILSKIANALGVQVDLV